MAVHRMTGAVMVLLAIVALLLGLLYAYASLVSWFGEEPKRVGGVLSLALAALPAIALAASRRRPNWSLGLAAGAGPLAYGLWGALGNGSWLLLAWPALWYTCLTIQWQAAPVP